MMNNNPLSFESLLRDQIQSLTHCNPQRFSDKLTEMIRQGMDWFKLDRVTLFPNSLIFLNEGKTISVARSHIPTMDVTRFDPNESRDYLELLRSRVDYHYFSREEIKQSEIKPLRDLYWEGAHWHGVITLKLFGQTWGALGFSRFSDKYADLSALEREQLRSLCDIWLVYWQHANMSRNLYNKSEQYADDSEKLLRLTKKQLSVLTLLAQGFTAKQCAEKLSLSHRTIESHKYRLLDTLDLHSHTDLVQFALRNGIGIEHF